MRYSTEFEESPAIFEKRVSLALVSNILRIPTIQTCSFLVFACICLFMRAILQSFGHPYKRFTSHWSLLSRAFVMLKLCSEPGMAFLYK